MRSACYYMGFCNCHKRAARLIRWLLPDHGDRFVLENRLVQVEIPKGTVLRHHARATLLALVARALFPCEKSHN